MREDALALGDVIFEGLEILGEITIEGRTSPVRKAAGAEVVAGASRSDLYHIKWHGRLLGATARERAAAIQALLQSGAPVAFFCDGKDRRVKVALFAIDGKRAHQISYRIECVIVQGSADTAGGSAVGRLGAATHEHRVRRALTSLARLLGRQVARDCSQVRPPAPSPRKDT